jgi:hypothetical protein
MICSVMFAISDSKSTSIPFAPLISSVCKGSLYDLRRIKDQTGSVKNAMEKVGTQPGHIVGSWSWAGSSSALA